MGPRFSRMWKADVHSVNPQPEPARPQRGQTLGLVTKIAGAQITVTGQIDSASDVIGIGGLVKICGYRDVIGIINSMELEGAAGIARVLSVRLVGEIITVGTDDSVFQRGVARYPALGAVVTTVTNADLLTVYARPAVPSIRVGRLGTNDLQPAYVMVDELLAKHFAVVGSTGCGKSCAVTLLLSELLAHQPNAHVILLDPHNEYASAFGPHAEVLNLQSSSLPFWMLNHEEAVRILVRGGTLQEQEVQAIILKDAIRHARQSFATNVESKGWITVDTPVPYPVHELRRTLREAMGQVTKSDTARPYLQLESRLASLTEDRRFSFMFGEDFVEDTLAELVGRLLRIPVRGRPVTILDLSGVPSEIADVIVSVVARMIFDFTLWSDPDNRLPVLLACEEAHRYLPASGSAFAACTRAISRIAREGRKYGLSLALISQRPSELAPQALSQCGTIFALRMANDLDQGFVERALPDTGEMMLAALPNLPAQEAVVFGEAVSLPMHVRFDNLAPEWRPRSQSARFSKAWQTDSHGVEFLERSIRRWRTRSD